MDSPTNTSSTVSEHNDEEDDILKIYLRIKDIPEDFSKSYTITDKTIYCKVPLESVFSRNAQRDETMWEKKFFFTKVFGPSVSQSEIFNDVVKAKVLSFINGSNATIMMYGASNSGKTYTTVGNPHEPGLIPRSLEYLFSSLPGVSQSAHYKPLAQGGICPLSVDEIRIEADSSRKLIKSISLTNLRQHISNYEAMQQRLSVEPPASVSADDVHLEIWVSYVEIYNEKIYDLLQMKSERGKNRKILQLGQSNGHNYIKDLSYNHVKSSIEAFQLLQYGLSHLTYARTSVNANSSRSHSIFTVKLIQVHQDGSHMSDLNFCDLAGHERSKNTQNVGKRLKETSNINSSLSVLRRCIQGVRDLQKGVNVIVPYRDSKLTQLFQDALSGKDDISLIITFNPAKSVFDESQHILKFSAIAQEIKLGNSCGYKKNRFSAYLSSTRNNNREDELEEQVEVLREQLHDLQLEAQDNFDAERRRLIQGYSDILEIQKKHDAAKLQSAQEMIDKLKKQLQSKSNEEVIVLDSSSDSDDDDDEVSNLKKTLEEAASDYNEMREKYQNVARRLYELEEKCADLEDQLAYTKDKLQQYTENVDSNSSSHEDVSSI